MKVIIIFCPDVLVQSNEEWMHKPYSFLELVVLFILVVTSKYKDCKVLLLGLSGYKWLEIPLQIGNSGPRYKSGLSHSSVASILKDGMKSLFSRSDSKMDEDHVFGCALSAALCYIHQYQHDMSPGGFYHSRNLKHVQNSEVICLQTELLFSLKETSLVLNSAYCLLKEHIRVTGYTLYRDHRSEHFGCDHALKKVAYITKGYSESHAYEFFLEKFLLLHNIKAPKPPSEYYDMRYTCSCHNENVTIGSLCNVCSAIFCNVNEPCPSQCTIKL